MIKKPYIICSAVHFQDGKKYHTQPHNVMSGFVIAGRRHDTCFATLTILLKTNDYSKFSPIAGFITSEGAFVDRKAAYKIAKKADQLSFIGKEEHLISEDLY